LSDALTFPAVKPLARIVTAEILDSLPANDPDAQRSRRDLIRVDRVMGNTRWMLRKIRALTAINGPIVEIGAGDGRLSSKLLTDFPKRHICALDICPRPENLHPAVKWIPGDFFQTLESATGGICMGSLILHHFSDEALRKLGGKLQAFDALVFCEPLRSRISLGISAIATPLVGQVTRHDMPASIRAGFLPGELAKVLGLEISAWNFSEKTTCRGGLRFCAVRRK
jgi:hypothetical protein